MTTIPEMCMAYTEVFTTLKLELVITMFVGVLIGHVARRLEK
jgi:hypothetical protein